MRKPPLVVVVIVFLLVPSLLVLYVYELTDFLLCFNYFYGFIGRFDWNIEGCNEASKRSINTSSLWWQDLNRIILHRKAKLYTTLRDYDKAMDVYEQELIPSCHQEGNLGLYGLALSEVADIYKSKAQYQKGLDKLRKARMQILSNEHIISTSLKEDMLTDNNYGLKNMQYLLDAVKEQEGYTAALVKAAKRYRLYDRSHDGGADAACTPGATNLVFSSLPHITASCVYCMCVFSLGLVSYFVRWCVSQPSRAEGIYIFIRLCPLVTPLYIKILGVWAMAWGFTQLYYVEQLIPMANMVSIAGNKDIALQLYDEARCDILANPLQFAILTGALGYQTFLGPLSIYAHLQLDDMVDALAETIHELVELNTLLGDTSEVLSHYQQMMLIYSNRGAEELANTYARLAEREMDRLAQLTSWQSRLQQQKGNERSIPIVLHDDETKYEL